MQETVPAFLRRTYKKRTEMKKQIREFLNTELIRPDTALAVSFITPVAAYLIMFAMRGIYPFGNRTIFGSDLYHQYGPFLAEYHHKFLTGDSFFYSWNMGLGMNFWALFAYYLSSPFNLLLVLVPQKYLVEGITFLIVFKIGMCGLSMTWYLRKHCCTYDFGAALFGILYAMSGYVTAYHWNIMWMDCIILFPMVIFGLEKLVYDEDWRFYVLFLGLSIWCNYYISLMTCMFLVLYYLVLMILKEKNTWKKSVRIFCHFICSSLLAGGLSAVLIIPEWIALKGSFAGQFRMPDFSHMYFHVWEVLARHLANVGAEYEMAHYPNLYCGVIALALVPLYLNCKSIRRMERILYGSLAVLLLLSFCSEALEYVWHGFHFPNCFPARQSYIYIFLILFMCYRVYGCLQYLRGRTICLAVSAAVLFICAVIPFSPEKYFSVRSFMMSAVYLILYAAAILCWKYRMEWRHNALLMAYGIVAVETLFSVTDNGMFENVRSEYTERDAICEEMISEVKDQKNFCRIKVTPADKVNNGSWLHYPAVSSFSSTNYYAIYEVFHRLGCESHPNYYSNNGATPLVDMLLGVNYEISAEGKQEKQYRKLIEEKQDEKLYQLFNPFPLGFTGNIESMRFMTGIADHPALQQNAIAAAVGEAPVLIRTGKTIMDEDKQIFIPETDGEYFAYYGNFAIDRIYAEYLDKKICFDTCTPECFVDLGYCRRGEHVAITAKGKEKPFQAEIYRFEGDGLKNIRERIIKSEWKISKWESGELEGAIECASDDIMMTTIPYDPGWKVYVDGKKVEAISEYNGFLGVELPGGKHKIRMKYIPSGFTIGAAISGGCLIVLLMLLRFQAKRCFAHHNDNTN